MTSTVISPKQQAFIAAQEMFFVGTAPLTSEGHINVSPKGVDGSFILLNDHTVAYLDSWGTGIETVAHLRENGRVCLMFCSFSDAPNILRLHGQGEVIVSSDAEFDLLRPHFPARPGTRSIVRVHVTRVCDSCGFGVPQYDFVSQRTLLQDSAVKSGPAGVSERTRRANATSIDGLQGL